MEDITILATTLNKLPRKWQAYHKKVLLEAAAGRPIITLSKEPMDFGLNVIQTEKPCLSNIYFQILKGARLAKTKYVGVAEDDCLYPKEHFDFRPPMDTFAYNRTRWGLLTWGEPFYFHKAWSGNCVMIAPRELLIEALEERFAKYPVLPGTCEPGASVNERRWGLTRRKYMTFFTLEPVVCLNHIYAYSKMERKRKKKPKPIRAYDIPKWGRADTLLKQYFNEESS